MGAQGHRRWFLFSIIITPPEKGFALPDTAKSGKDYFLKDYFLNSHADQSAQRTMKISSIK